MLPYNSWVSRIAFGVFFLILIGYGYFEARGLLYGPQISVPDITVPVHDALIHIRGTAQHIASLSLNGKQITVTESGAFDEPYLLAPGTNRIVFDAKDKYGNATQRVVQVVYTPTGPSATTPIDRIPVATSTTSTTSATSLISTSSASTSPIAH